MKNNRLAAAGFVWAFVGLRHSPGAGTLYYHRREHGDRHAAALRNVFNRLIGCLFHCLADRPDLQRGHGIPSIQHDSPRRSPLDS